MKATDRASEMKSVWQHEVDFDKSCSGAKYLCHPTQSAPVISLLKIIAIVTSDVHMESPWGAAILYERKIDFI